VHSYTILNILTGEYASAIETLVTAISLIKQSKVANDDRCKILISSLQDTLHGVETKSYGSARRGKYFSGKSSYLFRFLPSLKKMNILTPVHIKTGDIWEYCKTELKWFVNYSM
jgi:hypothetical protein